MHNVNTVDRTKADAHDQMASSEAIVLSNTAI